MRPFPMRLGAAALLLAAGVLAATRAGGQAGPEAGAAPPQAAAEPAGSETIRAEEISIRAAEMARLLPGLQQRAEPTPEILAIQAALDEIGERRAEAAASAIARLRSQPSETTVRDAERVWKEHRRELEGWGRTLAGRGEALVRDLDDLDRTRERWERTGERAEVERLPRVVREQIEATLASIAGTRAALTKRRNAVLTLQSRVARQEELVAPVLDEVARAEAALWERLWLRESPPLWRPQPWHTAGSPERVRAAWRSDRVSLGEYTAKRGGALALAGVAFALLVGALALLARRVEALAAGEPELEATARVLGRPVAAAILVFLMVYPFVVPGAPRLLRLGFSLLLVFPALRLLPIAIPAWTHRPLYFLTAWFAIGWLGSLLEPAPELLRLYSLVETLVAAALVGWATQPALAAAGTWSSAWQGGVRLLSRGVAGVLLVAALANAVGNVSLGELLARATLLSGFSALLLRGSASVLTGVYGVALRTRPLRLLRGVQRQGDRLMRSGSRWVRRGLAALWVWVVLGFYLLQEPVVQGLRRALGAAWPFGELELSLGDLLAFGLTIWVAFLISRCVRFVLDEDVLPRARLPRGVPYALSRGVHYAIALLGFLLAVSAAGFDMSRFALLVGALGVGIGIGLQDVVNNFVSGLILLFERPIQSGDSVEIQGVLGQVRRIGMRSSTVRTWGGSEVIVPNSKFVSEIVTNWTLSDSMRRLDVPIGVAYGTDPERVLALLLDLAKQHPEVMTEPGPQALFLQHGESSLDFELRAWTNYPNWMEIRSQLTVAVNRALVEAGIGIPFPQRDLHLRSLDGTLAEKLRGAKDPG